MNSKQNSIEISDSLVEVEIKDRPWTKECLDGLSKQGIEDGPDYEWNVYRPDYD